MMPVATDFYTNALTIMGFGALVLLIYRQVRKGSKSLGGTSGSAGHATSTGYSLSVAQNRRGADQLNLTPEQLLKYDDATKQIKEGKVLEGALTLESLGMYREAISALEAVGHIDEACEILMRLSRPNRAGVVYFRNKMHVKAAQYFLLAGDLEGAAKAFQEAGKQNPQYFLEAARVFEQMKREDRALEAYIEAHDSQRVVELCMKNKAWGPLRKYMSDAPVVRDTLKVLGIENLEKMIASLPLDKETIAAFALWAQLVRAMELIDLCLRRMESREHTGMFWSQLPDDLVTQIVRILCQAPRYRDVHGLRFLNRQARSFFEIEKFETSATLYQRMERHAMAAKCFARVGNITMCLEHLHYGGERALIDQMDKVMQIWRKEISTDDKGVIKCSADALKDINRVLDVVDPERDEAHLASPFSISA
jgi:tetratricopeptide (TPR) repeat protein